VWQGGPCTPALTRSENIPWRYVFLGFAHHPQSDGGLPTPPLLRIPQQGNSLSLHPCTKGNTVSHPLFRGLAPDSAKLPNTPSVIAGCPVLCYTVGVINTVDILSRDIAW